jgi:hypothetical protein
MTLNDWISRATEIRLQSRRVSGRKNMRHIIMTAIIVLFAIAPADAVDFLGVELCAEPVSTRVVLPADSPLSLESAEVGRHGGLVLLLHSKKGTVLDQVDDLMASFTGSRGTGDERKLEWTGEEITGFAQVIKKGYVALAVTATEDCTAEPESVAAEEDVEAEPAPAAEPEPESPEVEEAAPVVAAAAVATEVEAEPEVPAAEIPDFELKGRLKHTAAEGGWVDVMGVVVNNSGASYAVASFDLSLYDDAGELICVDTISVNQLREGQERAFRGAIRCADYVADEIASWKLQFAGGH